MRGYFGIGVENVSKPMNVGNLFRSAHAFGASFVFTINATYNAEAKGADTSRAAESLPYYRFAAPEELLLPRGCRLVGVELLEEAEELPSFPHPAAAAYLLGSERGRLSEALLARCDHLVAIPTRFSINLAVAGAIVMYDRIKTLGRYPARPVSEIGAPEPLPAHHYGEPIRRKRDATP